MLKTSLDIPLPSVYGPNLLPSASYVSKSTAGTWITSLMNKKAEKKNYKEKLSAPQDNTQDSKHLQTAPFKKHSSFIQSRTDKQTLIKKRKKAPQ